MTIKLPSRRDPNLDNLKADILRLIQQNVRPKDMPSVLTQAGYTGIADDDVATVLALLESDGMIHWKEAN